MKNLFLTKTRWLVTIILLTALGSGNVWGATFVPKNFSGQGTSGTGSSISATVDGVTFACDKGYGTTQIRCYGGGKITISSSSTITAISFTFSATKYQGGLKASYTELSTTSWAFTLTGQARITEIVVTTAGCTYYVYNGSTWESIGTTGFNEVVLAPPTLPDNGHGAGNGCWTTDKNIYDGGDCVTYTSGDKYRYVPNPGGDPPDAENKPGNGTCELYAVYWDGGCLSTKVKAAICARIWEEPEPNTPSVSGSNVTLSWSAVTGASGYHLYVTDGDSDVFDGDVNSTSKTLSLAAGTYLWTVAANSPKNDACDSNPADGEIFEIVGCTDISSSTVTGVSVTPSKVGGSATWTAVANATSYEVKVYAGTATSGSALFSAEPTSNSCAITGLSAGTQYTVVVKAKNSCSTSNQGKATWTTSALTLYTVTWSVNGSTYTTTENVAYNTTTLTPANPDVPGECTGSTFMGWTENSSWASDSAPGDLFNGTTPTITGNKTFYAVFADEN